MKRNPDGKYLKRCYEIAAETRDNTNESIVDGHAAVYGQRANIGDMFYEVIQPGAFDRADLSDVALYLNHNIDALPMARSRVSSIKSTMKVTPDERGLHIQANLDTENNQDAKALCSAIKRGDISGMSFAFLISDEEWADMDAPMPTRTIKSIAKVFEVSAVTYPAYTATDISARSGSLESDRAALERAKGVDINIALEREKTKLKARNRK